MSHAAVLPGVSAGTKYVSSTRVRSKRRDIVNDVLLVHELAQTPEMGNLEGRVPKDPDGRKEYLAQVREELKHAYGLDEGLLAKLIANSKKINGGGIVREELELRAKAIALHEESQS